MQQVKIDAPDGFIIDVDNSDLTQGVVRFKAAPPDLGIKRRGDYFTVTYGVSNYINTADSIDNTCLARYNYYHTHAEAEAVGRYQAAFRKLLHLANALNPEGWKGKEGSACWEIGAQDTPHYNYALTKTGTPGTIFFYSKEACQAAIDNMTAEELEALRIQQIYPRGKQ